MSAALLAQEVRRTFPSCRVSSPFPRPAPSWSPFLGKRRPDLIKLVALLFSLATGAMSIWMLAEFEEDDGRLPVRVRTQLDQRPRHLVAPGRRRHLVVPGRADRRAVPPRHLRCRSRSRREAVLRVAAPARGRVHGRVHGARPVLVLRVLRDRARADVLPHRQVGPRAPAIRGDEVLHLHHVRLGAHARRLGVHGGAARPRRRAARSRSTS